MSPSGQRTNRRALFQLAARQHGYVTAAQARDTGYSYQAQKYHVDHGNWVRADRGVFRLVDWPAHPADHLVRWVLWSGAVGVVSHASALSVHDLGDLDPARVHLSVPARFRRSAPEIVLHRPLPPEADIEDREGFRVTTPSRALAECAQARIEQQWLDGAVAEALSRGLTTPRRLRAAATELGPTAELGAQTALAAAGR
ncbi:type IV toxin-antitoxin system AbiEi family antitoxin domain-containing protein [Micromonospora sp. NPDC049081]|uniref:type IV toxin-antitoxin system AbiEi family antitoxin domain-containing protein n=1 Tax=Micromonospora sp. NPDC049081 TaxID=3155150 RepID=UPI0033CDB5E1